MELNLNQELWMKAKGSEHHEVSNKGNVRTTAHFVNCGPLKGKGVRHIEQKILKPFVNNQTKYLQVMFSDRKKHSVHRLVAFAFCSGYAEGLVVNHKNGIRTDNNALNLEWVTQAKNNQHAYSVLNKKGSTLGKFSAFHPTSKAIVMTLIKTGENEVFDCALDAVKKYPFLDSSAISRCCHGKWKKTKGYSFRFSA
jgi:hypothetical protein